MFCTYCGKEIEDNAVFCPNCGKKFLNSINPTDEIMEDPSSDATEDFNNKPSSELGNESNHEASNASSGETGKNPKKNTGKGILVVLVLLLIIIMVKSCSGGSDSNFAMSAAQAVAKEYLRSPSSAEFSDVEVVDKDDYGRYLVTMTIDSQNGFGAMVRTNVAVVVRIDPDEEKYYWNRSLATCDYEEYEKEMTLSTLKILNDWGEEPSD